MDKGADRIAQDIKDIVQTRIAIAEKLGAIEQHVGSTMQHARTTMTQVADKTTSSVHETLKATKEAFDPRVHVARHPWVFVGGTMVLGYAVGALYRRGWRIDGVAPYYPRRRKGCGSDAYERLTLVRTARVRSISLLPSSRSGQCE